MEKQFYRKENYNQKEIALFSHFCKRLHYLKEGAWVRVKRGPFQGAEGTLAVKGEKYKFVVNIGILGRSVGVGIHADDLEEA